LTNQLLFHVSGFKRWWFDVGAIH